MAILDININTIITSVINSHNNNNDVEDEDIIGMNITRNVANRNNTQKLSKELIECLENDIKPHKGSHNDYCGDFYGENSRDNCKIFGCGAKASAQNKLVRCSYCNNAACLAKTDCNQLQPSKQPRKKIKGKWACLQCIQIAAQRMQTQ